MSEILIAQGEEEKRLKDFQRIAENWDNLSEYARGKLEGTISTIAGIYCNEETKEKAGVVSSKL